MPAAVLIPAIATAVAGGTAAAASIHGSNVQSKDNRLAAAASEKANTAALEEQRRQDAQAKAQFDQQQKQQADQWNQQQQVLAVQDARKDPYRQASRAALLHLSDLLGINIGSGGPDPGVAVPSAAARVAPPAQGFMPNAPVPPVMPSTQPNYRPVIPMAALYRPTAGGMQ